VLATKIPHLNIPWGVSVAISATFTFGAAWLTIFIWRTPQPNARTNVELLEKLAFASLATSCAVWSAILLLERPESFLLSGPVFAFGALILFFIYLLDRFYYTSLLVGAVNRAEKIERGLHQKVNLAHEVSFMAPGWTYTVLPTLLYVVPLVILLNVAFALITYTEEKPSSAQCITRRHAEEDCHNRSH
jgi:hypothetical protein